MPHAGPTLPLVWFASRAFGIVAMVFLGLSVAAGLAISDPRVRSRGRAGRLMRFHQAGIIVTWGLIAAHAGLLLFDSYLHPGLAGITVPFTLGYRTVFTGVGVVASWLAAIFTASFYVRRLIGVRTWRVLHRFTIVVYLLALTHAVGSGTDAHRGWMIATLIALTAPIAAALGLRALPGLGAGKPPRRTRPAA
jgi:methionine sulfoxide reductase heme-binding subunit